MFNFWEKKPSRFELFITYKETTLSCQGQCIIIFQNTFSFTNKNKFKNQSEVHWTHKVFFFPQRLEMSFSTAKSIFMRCAVGICIVMQQQASENNAANCHHPACPMRVYSFFSPDLSHLSSAGGPWAQSHWSLQACSLSAPDSSSCP